MRASAAERASSATITVAPVPQAPQHADTRELRLALVCYGGVSLAIYMHGVTKEIQKLVAASKAYDEDQDKCPWEDEPCTERAYWKALERAESASGTRTRVVVDIVSGTSAGGINGIILAKALAHDLPQDALREVWLERGDIKKLMRARRLPTLPLRLAAWAAGSRLKSPPLDGDLMFGWILDALRAMDREDTGGTLMPPQHRLELYVTLTDFFGFNRLVPAGDPRRVTDKRHRHVLVFGHAPGRDQLGGEYNAELAFAARATSSFPGAFPPINLGNIAVNAPGWNGLERFKDDFFAIYPLSDAVAEDTHFVDGGVLDNYPFRHAIEAIRRRPASLQVDRKLAYIEPDPKELVKRPERDVAPALMKTIWGGLSSIPHAEPVLDDLLEVRALNERIARVEDIVEAGMRELPSLAPGDARPDSLAEIGGEANRLAAERSGFAFTTYVQLKLFSVVERLAALACQALAFPLDSNQAFFVHDVLVRWARDRGILTGISNPTELQLRFLRDFDLDYGERRLRFVISYVSGLYGEDGGPPRGELNLAKQRLYELISELASAAADAGGGGRADVLRDVLGPGRIAPWLERPDPDRAVEEFAAGAEDEIDAIRTALSAFLDERLGDFGAAVWQTLLELTGDWDDRFRSAVFDRYLGFPLWDVLIFPLQAIADVGELNKVEVLRFSPEDVRRLRVPGQAGERPTAEEKLRGVGMGHFGAFFSREARENDYLWGRLDTAERLIGLLLGETPPALCADAFRAILDQEEPSLAHIPDLFAGLREQLAEA